MEETVVMIINKPSDIKYTCPYCLKKVEQNIKDFKFEQGFDKEHYSDWSYKEIECPHCKKRMTAKYFIN